MNYGKTAYLKIIDIEKELALNKNSSNLKHCYLELHKPNINQIFTDLNSYTCPFPSIKVKTDSPICFQIKADISAITFGDAEAKLYVNGTKIYEEDFSLNEEEKNIIIFKTFNPLADGELDFYLEFVAKSENMVATLNSVSVIVLGAEGDSVNVDLELRALSFNNNLLVSYIDDGKLYYTIKPLNTTSLDNDDFIYHSTGISHCYTIENHDENNKENLVLYKVDQDNNLTFSYPFLDAKETLIEKNVSVVYACPCPKISGVSNIVAYIKDGQCYFRTMRNKNILSEKKLVLPSGNYIDIRVVSHPNSDYLYIIASHENGSNYIIRSIIEVSTGAITEMLHCSNNIFVTKYIDIEGFMKEHKHENLNCNFNLLIKSFVDYESLFEKFCKESLNLTYSVLCKKYLDVGDVLYGVKIDKANLTPGEWESYTDEAETFSPAFMDFTSNTFVDNGWINRWPFNLIKPCLMLNGKVIDYLNPNDYTKFESGETATINKASVGQVMIEFPLIYYKISQDDTFYYIQISSKPREGFVNTAYWHNGVEYEKIYISAYLCGSSSFKSQGFHSLNNIVVNYNIPCGYTTGYTYLQKFHGENYEIMPFQVWQLLQVLYLIMFKNTNSQKVLGYGYGVYKQRTVTGEMNTLGMYYGKSDKTKSVKLFGLEHLYGPKSTLVTGLYVDTSGKLRYLDPTKKDSSYNPNYLSNYETFEDVTIIKSSYVANHEIIANNLLGFIGTSASNDYTKGFCDGVKIYSGTAYCSCGGVSSNNMHGMFSCETIKSTITSANNAIRLVYYPK